MTDHDKMLKAVDVLMDPAIKMAHDLAAELDVLDSLALQLCQRVLGVRVMLGCHAASIARG